MHVYVQKSTSTTRPSRSCAVRGSVLSHAVAPSKAGSLDSTGSSEESNASFTLVSLPLATSRSYFVPSPRSSLASLCATRACCLPELLDGRMDLLCQRVNGAGQVGVQPQLCLL